MSEGGETHEPETVSADTDKPETVSADTDKPETEEAHKEKYLAFRKFEAEVREQKRLRKEKIRINTEKNIEKKINAELGIEEDVGNQDKEDVGRKWTISIAVPASLLNNAISPEMRTYIAGEEFVWLLSFFPYV